MSIRLKIDDGRNQPRVHELRAGTIRLGRSPECEIQFDWNRFPALSGVHAAIKVTEAGRVFLKHLSRSNPTLVDGVATKEVVELQAGSRVQLGPQGPTIDFLVPEYAADSETKSAAKGVPQSRQASASDSVFDVVQGGVIGRDQAVASFVLEHPMVSRSHARLVIKAKALFVSDLGSANGTFVNGTRIDREQKLDAGDLLDIGPFAMKFDGRRLTRSDREKRSSLVVDNVGRTISVGGQRRDLLQGVSFEAVQGELIAIMGPSGSGKSTLLGIISGRQRPDRGQVRLRERDVHQQFELLKHELAVVPQHVSLHQVLTVESTLGHTAALRLPSDFGPPELAARVDEVVRATGLEQRRKVRVQRLSGGQLKRVGLGTELLADPGMLFLDEVTSGLDEQSDGEIMQLFRSLAETGKTLICVTHNLAHVPQTCHRIVVLTAGGCLAWYGPPDEALEYFGVESLASIYPQLAGKQPQEWARAFATFRGQAVQESRAGLDSIIRADSPVTQPRRRPSPVRQWLVLTARAAEIWKADALALVALFGQSLLVGVLLCLVFGSLEVSESEGPLAAAANAAKTRNLLFLLGVSSLWLGCNNSVKEIVKERGIFQRERDYNLIPEAWLASKTAVMLVIGISQALLLGLTANFWCELPGDWDQWFARLGSLAILSVTGTLMGLALSAVARTEELAVALVPVAIIPQIVLAGVVASLSGFPLGIAKATISAWWGQHLLESTLDSPLDVLGAADKPEAMVCLAAILAHALVFLLVAWSAVRWLRFRS